MSPVLNYDKLTSHAGNKGGSSGAFMFQTYDNRFIIKTITASELKTLLKMLQDLSTHFHDNKHSYITRILGLYSVERVGKNSFYLMLMECILPPIDQMLCVFDLKGSLANRNRLKNDSIVSIEMIPRGIVCKDIDFLQTQKHIDFIPEDCALLLARLESDVRFLERQKVMDYSLLLGLTDDEELLKPYASYSMKASRGIYCSIGVIDFLQSYNYRKRLEYFGLVIRKRNEPSCIKPTLYSARFIEFINKVLRPI